MKKLTAIRIFLLLQIVLMQLDCIAQPKNTSSESPIRLADPSIFYHNDTYYLYGTGKDTRSGFVVYESKDLLQWTGPSGSSSGYALKKGDSFGEQGFWAPQVFQHNGKFYLAYTADEQIVIATGNDPKGPFRQQSIAPISGTGKQIDPFLFKDKDGKVYLYFVKLTEGNRLFVAEMKPDLSDIVAGSVTPVLHATLPWENTANVNWPVTEGPAVYRHGGYYYLLYSANDFRNTDYAVGYAVSRSPLGPWTKAGNNPIIDKNQVGHNGPGHGDILQLPDGSLSYVLHTHFNDTTVRPRLTGMVTLSFVKGKTFDSLTMNKNSFRFLNDPDSTQLFQTQNR
ncbi:glycoside hydrolase family 43 protein [Flavihumibacter solisilvae]|uniref:glycoside hydrolase family 43 protein n=1 Tax=Flavihumibacter solisilvae TaxID=1349421 RepID=UPI001F085166|nr:glycoside hydrolase family 43 protein [Flavihumibacter solisilvae]